MTEGVSKLVDESTAAKRWLSLYMFLSPLKSEPKCADGMYSVPKDMKSENRSLASESSVITRRSAGDVAGCSVVRDPRLWGTRRRLTI